ncbi:MAG: translation elongation factor Ts [Gemmataceae bacterium]|nr:translation elongation factor Ts [Gemmataceae bacterium]
MSAISAAEVKSLRDRTNAPMMDCKAALVEAQGDMEKAVEVLRKKNATIQAKKGARETAEGRIAFHINSDNGLASLIEVRCESAPVASNESFMTLCADLAAQVSIANPASVQELLEQPFHKEPGRKVNDRIGDVVGLIRENMKPARFVRLQGGAFGSYIHHDGAVGVLLQVEGNPADTSLLRDICMHIAAKSPSAGTREEVAKDTIEREMEIARSQAAATGKPANIVEKIAEGKVKTWFAENVLLEQPFVKDDKKMVGDILKGAGLKFVRFVRYRVGELS